MIRSGCKKIFYSLFLFWPLLAWSVPESVTVVFLAEPTTRNNASLLITPITFSNKIAGHDFFDEPPENCIPREGGCFHPQYGFIEFRESSASVSDNVDETPAPKEIYHPSYGGEHSMDAGKMNLVNCEEPGGFNLYCGTPGEQGVEGTRPPQAASPYQVWVDISTSMRRVDYSREPDFCKRRMFVEKLARDCPQRPTFSVFNTSLMPVASFSAVCRLSGNNSTSRLIDWIQRSEAENLVIITDVDEINNQLMTYLDSIGAKTIGAGDQRIFASQLTERVSEIIPTCSK